MTTSVFEKKSKQDLIDYLHHASKYIQMDISRVYDVTLNQIKFFKNQNIPYEDLREMKVLEARWYKALETGKPDYSVYASPFYFVDIWVCWVTYSRKYLQMIQSPKSMSGKSIVQDMGNVRTVIDLGCGFGYTCAAGSGAQNALKIGLVERRSWSQKIKKRENVHLSYKTEWEVIRTSKCFSASCSSDRFSSNGPPFGGGSTPTSH
jgi:hypothetical protein